MGLFEGRVVIVTGASGGIGLAAARLFALEGANVLITGRRVRVLEEVTVSYASIQGMVANASDPLAAPSAYAQCPLIVWFVHKLMARDRNC
jgi:NAD(P)-dependent dehydrogenase (short-subunit alcohol dehydrogenase family)